jgi:hypothetical protein
MQSEDSYPVYGDVDAVVDFATRTIVLRFSNTRIDEGTLDPLPLALSASITMNSGDAQLASYFSGSASNRSFNGGMSARFFGPVSIQGSSMGPAEIGGIFQLQSPNAGPVAIGGFLLRKI